MFGLVFHGWRVRGVGQRLRTEDSCVAGERSVGGHQSGGDAPSPPLTQPPVSRPMCRADAAAGAQLAAGSASARSWEITR